MSPQIERITKKIMPVLRRHDVIKAAIFGSIARGEAGKGSDVDILVKFKGKKSLLDLASLQMILADLLHRDVDVLTYNSLHPLLKKRILSEQKVIL
jgi:predicted nucleotidyltransferase